ncbi:transketolase family protein [Kitasatospora sp. NPDC057223]|uniref:transketolase family protein n=1 Tax=Kitasatospora sp. NPDC057223 TaxID=3346055 RepID=UPI00362B3FCF
MRAEGAVATRTVYRDLLTALMVADPATVCLDSDTGLFDAVDFGAAKDRYLNVGIAEHTMMGVAAALAADGWRPYVTTMAAFAGSRAIEAVKVDIAYNALPVRIVATHSGVSAGPLGPTHHALEDLAVMRALPNMTVLVPADASATEALFGQSAELPGPVYLRLGRKPTPDLSDRIGAPVVGRAQHLREGTDVLIAACGPLPCLAALEAADLLAADGISAGVLVYQTLKPFDARTLLAAAEPVRLVATVEEHWLTGGLGSATAEALAEGGPKRMLRVGLPDSFMSVVGGQEAILDAHGVTGPAVAGRIRAACRPTT